MPGTTGSEGTIVPAGRCPEGAIFSRKTDRRRRRAFAGKVFDHGVFDAALGEEDALHAFGPDLVREVVLGDMLKSEAFKESCADREREEPPDMKIQGHLRHHIEEPFPDPLPLKFLFHGQRFDFGRSSPT